MTYSETGDAQEKPVVQSKQIVVKPKDEKTIKEVKVDVKTTTTYSETSDDWGIGVALGFEQYRTDNINSASLSRDRVLRTTDSTSWHNSLWLVGYRRLERISDRLGYFAAAKVVGEDGKAGIKDAAIGLSYIIPGDKFTVGVGAVNHRVRTFGAGLAEGQHLPKRYGNDIPFRERSEWGIVLLVTLDLFPGLLKK